jgi:hypothetical protein
MARRAPPVAASASIIAARQWFSGTSSQAMSVWRRAIFIEGLPSPCPLPPGEGIQPLDRFLQGVFFLAEGEADVGLAELGVFVEGARGDRGDADVLD